MSERTVVVASRTGLHARPAALFVKAAAAQPAVVRLRVGDGKPADARSMLAILALRVGHGTAVTLSAEGEHADQALDALAELLARDLDAPEPEPAGQDGAEQDSAEQNSAAGRQQAAAQTTAAADGTVPDGEHAGA